MLITLIVFIFILGLLVFVHEFGHFWVAKKMGIRVHEFAFGFKPKLVSWKRGETEYAINLLPFGGYVKLEGEAKDTGKHSFMGRPPGVRATVLVAGVTMNLVLAWVLLTFTYIIGSFPLTGSFGRHPGVDVSSEVIVVSVSPNSPAKQAGIEQGDRIVSINREPVDEADEVIAHIKEQAGHEITVQYQRDGTTLESKAVPRENPPAGEGALGIGTGEASHVSAPWYRAPIVALLEVGSQAKGAVIGFLQFVSNLLVNQEVSRDVSGIVGIGAATGIVRRLGLGPLMQFTALISTNLAIINLLPILPLDGGHLLFTGMEAIRRKPVKEIYRQWVALAGLMAILLLFLLVTYQDIIRFAIIERLKNLF